MKVEELIERYKAGRRDFLGVYLRRAYLSGADLRGADLRDANLSEAKLESAHLREANLSVANLSRAYLHRADLVKADFRRADLCEADLSLANLSRANLLWVNLCGADLRGADLQGADLRWANLRGANLQEADLRWANLHGADLREAHLSKAILPDLAIPKIDEIDRALLNALQSGSNCLDLRKYVIKLTGEAGKKLESELGTDATAGLIYARSSPHSVPDWGALKSELLPGIKQRLNESTQEKNEIEIELA